MKTDKQRLLENKIYKLVKEAVAEKFNYAGTRDALGYEDGRYFYQGTGSPESKERLEKLNAKTNGKKTTDDVLNRHGGKETPYQKRSKEYGKFETAPYSEGDSNFNYGWPEDLIGELRNLASRNNYEMPGGETHLGWLLNHLKTKEGAKMFIKYLYKNGFKNR